MQVIERLESLRRSEHAATVALIQALVECQQTRAHVDAGYRSVFQLLVERLRYSPAAASRRFAAMRCAVRCPVVISMLRDHRTSLTALAKVAPVLEEAADPVALWKSIDGRSPREVEAIVAGVRPVEKPAERVKPVAVKKSSAPSPEMGMFCGSSAAKAGDAATTKETSSGIAAAAEVTECKRSRTEEPSAAAAEVTGREWSHGDGSPGSAAEARTTAPSKTPAPAIESRMALSFTLTAEDHAAFERARARLSRTKPQAMSMEQALNALVQFYLEQDGPEPRKKKAEDTVKPAPAKASKPNAPTRHIPRTTRDQVFDRDGYRCTYVAPDGTRCTATHDLQIDHVQPFALGGTNEPENLRVLCGAHNRRRAEQTFGETATRRGERHAHRCERRPETVSHGS